MAIPARLPKICTCVGHADASVAAEIAIATCEQGGALLELRTDLLADPCSGSGVIREVLGRHPGTAFLATCRRRGNGGRFAGTVEQQVEVLQAAVRAGAAIVDLEIESLEAAPRALEEFPKQVTTLASYHDFKRTPDLLPVVRRLRSTDADILKVATRVVRPSDNLRLLGLCRDLPNVVVAGMGETGAPARLLAPQHGGLFTYAAPDADGGRVEPTAPGQIATSAARDLYRMQDRTTATKVYAVVAKPVGHSKSPLIHNRAFQAAGFDGIYLPLLVEPGHVEDFFRTLRELPLSGASVTIPHKQAVMPHLDKVDAESRGIGAVNTIYWDEGRVCGTNTDAAGVAAPLSKRVRLDRSRVLVVGNGGAARAALVALHRRGSRIAVTGRNPERVSRLALRHGVEAVRLEDLDGRYFDALVQATSVGMLPNSDDCLFPGRIPADVVFDLVYNPLETALLRHAADEGKTVISGIEMFVEQAAAQFRIWTGLDAPRGVMREAVLARGD